MSLKAPECEGRGGGAGTEEEEEEPENDPSPPTPASRSRLSPYLNIVVLGAGYHQVMLAGGLGDRQAHHRAYVAGQLADGLEPVGGEAQLGEVDPGTLGWGWGSAPG